MVPVIVFAIVQGLDEFRDTIPNFIEKFVKLKRFVLVDVVESVTIHMREHQIQQVRTQRLEIISKLISESMTSKNNFNTKDKSEKIAIDGVKFTNRNKSELDKGDKNNKSRHEYENKELNVNKNAQDSCKVGGITNAPLKLQIHEIRTKLSNSNAENKASMFNSGFYKEVTLEAKNTIDEQQTSQTSNQITQHISNNVCDACQDCKIERNIGICWHRFSNGLSHSIPSIKNSHCVEKFIGNWSCNDPSLDAWLKGKQSLAGPEDISQVSQTNTKQIASISKNNKKPKTLIQARSFEEIMACRLREDLSKQVLSTSFITNSKKNTNEASLNRSLLNSCVTFSNDELNMNSQKNNIDLTLVGPIKSTMKKSKNLKNIDILENCSENFEDVSMVCNNINYIQYYQCN